MSNSTEFKYVAYYDEFKNPERVEIVFGRFLFEDKDKFKEIIIDDEIIYQTIY